MRQVISTLLISTLFIVYMFQPFLNEIYHLRNLAVQIALDQGIEKAAVEGRFSDANINEMKMTLVDNLHFSADDIVFTGTTGFTPRGEYIEGTLGVPPGQLWVLPNVMGGNGDIELLQAYARQMSEYIER
ncbi:MAG: hypothetical protein RO469_00520 [Thermincola sp.]|nr:hypothetical protein [Thermincola sp.]MDT3701464.1 hypothetical protein [Thermincola sp.]